MDLRFFARSGPTGLSDLICEAPLVTVEIASVRAGRAAA